MLEVGGTTVVAIIFPIQIAISEDTLKFTTSETLLS